MLFEAKCVKLLRSKVFLLSKVFFEAKCASALGFLVAKWKFLENEMAAFLCVLDQPQIFA